jgi:mechanosensitive ion channel-like protein
MWRQVVDDVIRKTLRGFEERLEAFGPNLLAMAVILAIGIVAAAVARFALRRVLPRLGFDRFAESAGLRLILQKGGIEGSPSALVAAVTAWGVLGVFVLLAIGALNLQVAMGLVSKAFTWLPQLLIALAVLALGSMVAAFLRRSVLIAAVNAGWPSARAIAGGVHTALLILFAAIALEHLGVGRQIIVASFTILFGGVVLALALAFGLAGRSAARDVLDRVRRGPAAHPDEIQHL